ncbi:hypothetical protein [Actinoplanes palleronii]|uniref:Uncharacterized protein n=1 Tax=Actinoplanes palleronii TaxID=113570 RepID=A0ABQ4BJ98_9ACTN|nr:hypothetical protein [Actinoplanes palleronii]GIE70739.1 hypothetical protein Apa02nite_068470 [Actinoplanes palleronii]
MADLLATPADLASLLQRDVDTASATLALEVSTAVIQAAAGQRIVQVAADTATVFGGTDQLLALPGRPIISVTSVTYGGVLLSQGTASGTWRLAPGGIWRDVGWTECSWEPSPVQVVYSYGYAPGAQELQLGRGVCLTLARGLFTSPDGAIREQIDDYSVAYAEAASALAANPSLIALVRKQYGRKAGMVRIV